MRLAPLPRPLARALLGCAALALGAPLALGIAPNPEGLELPEVVVRGIDQVRLDAQRAGFLPLEAPRLAQASVRWEPPPEVLPSPALGAAPAVRSPGCAYRNPVGGALARATGGAEALYKTAMERLSRDLLDEAAAYLAQLRADHPRHPRADDAAFWLAEVRRRQGRTEEAAAFLRLVQGDYAPEAAYRLAWLLSDLGRAEEARPIWESLAGDPAGIHRPEALYRLGADRLAAGDPQEALDYLQPLRDLGERGDSVPREVRAAGLVALGLARQGSGDQSGAETVLLRFLLESPDHPSAPAARVALGWALLDQGRPREADRRFSPLLESDPPPELLGPALYGRVRALVDAEDHQAPEALRALEARAPEGPWVGWARADLGWLAFRQREYEEALSRYRSALRAWDAPKDSIPRFMIAESLYQLERYEEAGAAYRAVPPETDLGPPALHRGGLCALLAGRPAEAAALFEETLRRAPNYAEADRVWAWLGEARLRQGLRDQALRAFRAVPEGSAAYPQALQGRAWLAFQDARWDEAADLFGRFARAYPTDPNRDEALLNEARAHFNRRELRAALEALDRLEAETQDETHRHAVRYYRGWMLARGDREAEGRTVLYRLLEDAPQGPFASRAHQALGWLDFAAGHFDRALPRFEAALLLEPDGPGTEEAGRKRADSLYNLGRYTEALEGYVALGDTPEGSYGQALSLVRLGRIEDLAGAAERFASRHGDDPRAADLFLLLARALAERGEPEAAAAAYGRAAELTPTAARASQAQLEGARSLLEAGRTEEATEILSQVSEEEGPVGAAALWELARVLDRMGPPEAARDTWDALGRRSAGEDRCRALRSAAAASRDLEDWAGSEERLAAALGTCPPQARLLRQGVLADLGELRLRAGAPDRALAPLTEAAGMGLSPDGLRAFLALGSAEEAVGKGQEALETYLRIGYLYSLTDEAAARALLRAGGLLEGQGDPDRARALYEKVAAEAQGEPVREAQARLGRLAPAAPAR
ncbi:MAG: tetratricopeptide repeat protein [Deferrisomatales bacterium]